MTTSQPTPTSPLPATPTLIQRYGALMCRLMQFVAERYLRDRTEANKARMNDSQGQLDSLLRRMRNLLARIDAGMLPRSRRRESVTGMSRQTAPDHTAPDQPTPDQPAPGQPAPGQPAPGPTETEHTARRAKLAMGRGFGWLMRPEGPNQHELNLTRDQMGTLLQEPATLAKLALAPLQAGRIVRPLCHMLMLPTPEALRLPPRPRPARKPRSRAAKPVWVMPWGTPRVASADWPRGCVAKGETVPLRKRNRRRTRRQE